MKKMKKLLIATAALAAVIPLAVGSAFANSGQLVENRYDSSGVLIASGESSVLEVGSETLYFDVTSFPKYGDEENYKTTVTAEYSFKNPTSDTVKTKMGFPVGVLPDYFTDMSVFAPKVYKDDTELTVTTRHTYNVYSGYQSVMTRIEGLSDDYYADAFYNKDLTVTPYKLKYGGDTEEERDDWNDKNYMYVRYYADLTLDKSQTRYISDSVTDSATATFYEAGGECYIYVLGEDNFDTLSFEAEGLTYNGGVCKLETVPVTVEKQETITLKDLLLKNRKEEFGISEVDWFNGVMKELSKTSVSPVTARTLSYISSSYFLSWYIYELELNPNESAVNKVVTPIFPRYYGGGYEFNYFLSPAKSWSSFGSLEVVIRTKFELNGIYTISEENGSRYHSYSNVAGGYKVNFSELPDGELEFHLYDPSSPYESPTGKIDVELSGFGTAIIIIAVVLVAVPYLIGVTVAIVFLVKDRKKKNDINKKL